MLSWESAIQLDPHTNPGSRGGGGIEEQGSSTSILGQTDLTEGGIRELPLPADTKKVCSRAVVSGKSCSNMTYVLL